MLSWLFLLVILVQWMKIRSIGRGLDEIASQVGNVWREIPTTFCSSPPVTGMSGVWRRS